MKKWILVFLAGSGLLYGCGKNINGNSTTGPKPLCSSPSQEGVTTILSSTSSDQAGYLYAQAITLTSSTTAIRLSIAVGQGPVSGQIRMGIYNDNSNYPGNLVVDTIPQNVVANSWINFDLPDIYLPQPSSPTLYWIVHQFSDNTSVPNSGVGSGNWYLTAASTGWGVLPQAFPGSAGHLAFLQSVYISACP
jgi:hypothetical protein